MRLNSPWSISSLISSSCCLTAPSCRTSTRSTLVLWMCTNSMCLKRQRAERGAVASAAPCEARASTEVLMRSHWSTSCRASRNWPRITSCSTGSRAGSANRWRTKKRKPSSVGTRPALVCGCVSKPSFSSAASSLRIVAGLTPRSYSLTIAALPTGWAVSTYSWITMRSTCRWRSVRASKGNRSSAIERLF